ncbi:unnamed protein product [Clonostachys chloroleuca]|uniref:Rhodopsin domain-containing protein n=1 Tax=Clonostachys chloroleuca TaxID=1926264 RepID=A0AA35LRC7_9HYPO|nr:unnamed protein product [Clonostachys chloroleuca]
MHSDHPVENMNAESVIAAQWTLMSVAILLVIARLSVRFRLKQRNLILSDLFLVISCCAAVGLLTADIIIWKQGTWLNIVNPGVTTLKARFAICFLFDTGIYFPKFSIIALYYTLVPRTQPWLRIALYGLTAITTSCCLVTIFYTVFYCGLDIAANWSIEPGSCKFFFADMPVEIYWGMHLATEVLNFIFPFSIVRGLRLPNLREKIGLYIILGLGLITILVTIARYINGVFGFSSYGATLWGTAELATAISAVALTALRPLLRVATEIMTDTYNKFTNKYTGSSYAIVAKSSFSSRSRPSA